MSTTKKLIHIKIQDRSIKLYVEKYILTFDQFQFIALIVWQLSRFMLALITNSPLYDFLTDHFT